MEIIRARSEHAEALTEIAHAAKRHWGYPKRWIEAWCDILTMRPEFLATNIAYSAIEDDHAVGFYVLTKENDGIYLDHLWVIPAAMGRGIGRALFEHAVTQARDRGFNSIKIEADPNAEAFYRRLGAARVGTRIGEVEGERRELPLMQYKIVRSS